MAREGRLAADVSARLESASNMSSSPEGQLRVIQGNKGREKVDPLDVRITGKPLRTHIREFTAVFGLLFTIIAYFQAQHPDRASLTVGLLVAAPIFYLLGIFTPKLLVPVWKGWMTIAEYMGLVVNFVLLSAVWAIMVIPFGVGLKLIGKKVMDLSYRAPVSTYWEDRTDAMADFQLLERQY